MKKYPLLPTTALIYQLSSMGECSLGNDTIIPYPGSRDYYRLTSTPVWISDYIRYKVWGEIIYVFQNFNGVAVEGFGWVSYFIPSSTGYVVTCPC